MIKIIKYWRPGCTPCEMQSKILKQLSDKIVFELKEANVWEMDQALLEQKKIQGVPYLEIYWDDTLLYSQAGLLREEKLLEILVDKLA